jgi:hypothetical protein
MWRNRRHLEETKLNKYDFDYADKELIHSIQQLLVQQKESRGFTYGSLDGGEGKTAKNYLTENHLADMVPLKQRTIESLNYILEQAKLTPKQVLEHHQQRMHSQQTNNNQTNANTGTFQPNISFNGGTFGSVITGNNTVNVDIKN